MTARAGLGAVAVMSLLICGPALRDLAGALGPLVLEVGITAAAARVVWFLTRGW